MDSSWVDIPGYEGLYQISINGQVRSVDRVVNHSYDSGLRKLKGKLINQSANKKGYLSVILSKNGITKCFRTHRLVANIFIPNPLNLPEVNHIDEDKNNNSIQNLEWCDHIYNIRHGTGIKRSAEKRIGVVNTCGETHGFAKLNNKQVLEIFYSKEKLEFLSKKYNVGISCISEIRNKKAWKHLLINK